VKNAKYLLSGYNTVSKEDQEKVDIENYIVFFRKFHTLLGLSFFFAGVSIHLLLGELAAGIFIGVYPLLAYIFFIWASSKYFGNAGQKKHKVGVFILLGALLFVALLFIFGNRGNKLKYDKYRIEIKGMYGETIQRSDVESIQLVDKLPGVRLKTNGYSLGAIHKGYFKTADGEVVKLLVDNNKGPFLYILKINGKKIYYSSKGKSNQKLLEEINSVFILE
jgi:hypothetical protein